MSSVAPRCLILIPAFNEAATIGRVIGEVRRWAPTCDILVIDDGSTDATAAAATGGVRQQRPGVSGAGIVVSLPFNQGIGGAMQTGYRYAAAHGYDVAVQVDGDGQHPACELPRLIASLEASGANLVVGSRFLGQRAEGGGQGAEVSGQKSEGRHLDQSSAHGPGASEAAFSTSAIRNPQSAISPHPTSNIKHPTFPYRPPAARMVGIRVLRLLLRVLAGQRFTDVTSGFRAADRRAIVAFAHWYPDDYPEPEVLLLLRRAGFAVAELPVRMAPRTAGRTSIPFGQGLFYVLKVAAALLLDMLRSPWPRNRPQPQTQTQTQPQPQPQTAASSGEIDTPPQTQPNAAAPPAPHAPHAPHAPPVSSAAPTPPEASP